MNIIGSNMFKFEEYEIRTIIVDGETVYLAKDFSAPLGIKNIRDKLRKLDEVLKIKACLSTNGGVQRNAVYLTEAGVKQLLSLRRNAVVTNGYLYGFELKFHKGFYKFGRTTDWKKRKNCYTAFNTPGKMIFLKKKLFSFQK